MPLEHDRHELAPCAVVYCAAGQALQMTDPGAEANVPAAHRMQDDAKRAVVYEPFAHCA